MWTQDSKEGATLLNFFFWIVWSCRVKLCVSLNYPKSSHNHNLFSSLVAAALFCTKLPCDPRVCKRRDQSAKWMPSSLFWPIPTWISSLSRGSSRCTQALAPAEEVEGDPETGLVEVEGVEGICQRMAAPSQQWLETLFQPTFYSLLFSFVTALVCS